MQTSTLLQLPLTDLKLSEGFKQMADSHGFRNLQDILNWPVSVLILHHNFTYHHYQELRDLMKENNILDLLKKGK
jgi:hypothetical protein